MEDKEVKRFTTVDDIEKKKREERKDEFAKKIVRDLNLLRDKVKKDLDKKKLELRKQRTIGQKIKALIFLIISLIIFIDIALGSIWLLIKLIKYFIGFI